CPNTQIVEQGTMVTRDEQVPLGGAPYLWWKRVVGRVPGGRAAVAGMERLEHTVERVPILVWAWRRTSEVQDNALRTLSEHLPLRNGNVPAAIASPFVGLEPAAPPASNGAGSPAEAFGALLREAEIQSPAGARL